MEVWWIYHTNCVKCIYTSYLLPVFMNWKWLYVTNKMLESNEMKDYLGKSFYDIPWQEEALWDDGLVLGQGDRWTIRTFANFSFSLFFFLFFASILTYQLLYFPSYPFLSWINPLPGQISLLQMFSSFVNASSTFPISFVNNSGSSEAWS